MSKNIDYFLKKVIAIQRLTGKKSLSDLITIPYFALK